jgi:hypothetical protein
MTEQSPARAPLIVRLLRLQRLRLPGWQRAVLLDGSIALGLLLTLTDEVSAWAILVCPLVSALALKFHDLLAWQLDRPVPESPD